MSKKDVFNSFLVQNATYSGFYEIPSLKKSTHIPQKFIPFSNCLRSKDFDSHIMFYEDDFRFDRIWNSPDRYVEVLKKFKGVISPDFSLYRNMPLSMQIWNTYRGKALAHYWQENGIDVIANVRFSDERSYSFCFDGIPKHGIVSVGTHGCIQKRVDQEFFKDGVQELINVLAPHTIIIYGALPEEISKVCDDNGVKVLHFESEIAQYFFSKAKAEKDSSI